LTEHTLGETSENYVERNTPSVYGRSNSETKKGASYNNNIY
jgi:hypothetical protein